MAISNEDLRNAMAQMSGQQAWPHQLGAIAAMREAKPVSSPVAGGTPAQRRREMEQAQAQFEEQMRLARDQMAQQLKIAQMQQAAAAAARRAAEKAQQQAMAAAEQRRQDQIDSINSLVITALTKGDQAIDYIEEKIWKNRGAFDDPGAALSQAMQGLKTLGYEPWGDPKTIQKSAGQMTPIQPVPLGLDAVTGAAPIQRPPTFHDPLPAGDVFQQRSLQMFPQSTLYQDPNLKEPPPFWTQPPAPPPAAQQQQANLWSPSTWGNINPGFGARWK